MANVFDLLSQAATSPVSPTVQTPVSPTPANVDLYQTAAGIGTDRGMSSASQMERDLRTLSPNAFAQIYGNNAAADMMAGLQSASSDFLGDVAQGRSRSDLQATGDLATGVGSGFLNGLAGIVSLGAGAINDTAGAKTAEWIQKGNEWVQDTLQSDGLAAARRVQAARTGLEFRDNKAEADDAIAAGGSELLNNLKRIGKDAFDTVVTGASDPTMLTQGTADSIGSLVAGGPISKGLKVLGTVARSTLTAEVAASSAVARAAALGEAASMPAAIGLMEGGGAYQQSAAEVRAMNFDELQAYSPDFNSFIAEGMSPEDARDRVANNTGLTAAAIQAPIAAATGSLVARFEAHPFAVPTLRQGLLNTFLKEPLEEGVQSATGQLAQNYAVRENANNTVDLAEGVGEQVGQGALYGLTAAGSVQAPGIAKRAVIEGGRATYRGTRKLADQAIAAGQPVFAAVADRADRIQKQQDKASPVSDDVIRAATEDLKANQATDIPAMQAAVEATDATPESKAEATNFVTKLGEVLHFDPVAEQMEGLPESGLKARLFEATDRVDAVQQTARAITEATTPEEQMTGIMVLNHLMSQIDSVKDSDPEALYRLPAGPERDSINRYTKLVNQIENTPAVRNALTQIRKMADAGQFDQMAPVDDVSTQEGQQRAQEIAAVASMSLDRGNPEAIDSALKHANAGAIQLTPIQVATLKVSANLIRERAKIEKEIANSGLQTTKDVVSSQILASNDPLRKHMAQSGRQHADRVIKAMQAGDVEKAAAFQEDFGLFVQHMKNKVEALNTSFANNGVHLSYQALSPINRKWFDSDKSNKALHKQLWVDTKNARSLDIAQSIAYEQQALASIYNNINTAFPELGRPNIEPLSLPAELIGKPEALVKKFAEPKEAAQVTEQAQPAKVEPEQTTEAKVEAPVEVTPEPAVVETPVVEKPVEEETVITEEPVVEEPTPVKEKAPTNAVEALHPDLHTKTFSKTYRLASRTEAPTRIMAAADPFSVVLDALTSHDALQKFTNGSIKNRVLTDEAAEQYQQLIENDAPKLDAALTKSLDKFLSKKNNRERFLRGDDLESLDDGKVLSLVEVHDGKVVFNEALKNAAILAAIQWRLIADNFGSTMDPDVIAGLMDVEDSSLLSDDVINYFQRGLNIREVKSSLSNMIRQFWGVTADHNALKGFTDGIPEAMAAELLQAYIESGVIIKNTDTIPQAVAAANLQYDFTQYIVPRVTRDLAIRSYNTAIQDAVLTKPQEVVYLGESVPVVPTTQMNNPTVKLTDEQRETLSKASKTKYEANIPLMHFYAALGEEGFVNGFASGDLTDLKLNENHRASLQGKNMMARASFNSVFDTAAAMANSNNGTLDGAVIRYGLNMSRVGRMQMLGKHNPQSNKFMREVVLPTWATLDMTNEDNKTVFNMAVAQHLGLKIHKLGVEQSVAEITEKLNTPEVKAVTDFLSQWINDSDFNEDFNTTNAVDAIDLRNMLNNAGLPMTPGALHALFEVARLSTMEDKSAFRTGLYVEADGVTNGPFNAMMLMSIGDFTKDWVANVQKGGLSFGQSRSMDQLDKQDLYETSTGKALSSVVDVVSYMKTQKNRKYVLTNLSNLLSIMDITMPDVQFKEGVLTLNRGVAKNPLTITIYGSGARGIAGNLTDTVMESVYELFSKQMQMMEHDSNLTPAEAMFFGDPDAELKYQKLTRALDVLTNTAVFISKKGEYYRKQTEGVELLPRSHSKADDEKSFAERFTLVGDARKNFEQNMLTMFVNPLRAGITETIGPSLMRAVGALQKATDVQSAFLSAATAAAIAARVQERKAADPNYRVTNFLSQADLDAIDQSMREKFPLVESPSQSFLLAKSQRVSDDRYNYSRALDGTMRTPANYFVPVDAGVMGIAAMTIGTGDGMMIQNSVKEGIENSLFVFDGINVPLDKSGTYNQMANKAAFDAVMGNPLRMVYDSFSTFVDNAKEVYDSLDPLMRDVMVEKVFGKTDTTPSITDLVGELEYRRDELGSYADQVDARHRAIARMPVSLDQMAALAQPYHNGVESDSSLTNDQAVELLNQYYNEELSNRPVEAEPAADPVVLDEAVETETTSDNPFDTVGRKDRSSGVRILSQTSLRQLQKLADFTDAQKVIMGEILRSGAAKDYKIVTGSAEQIAAYQDAKSLSGIVDPNANGYTIVNEKMIYLINPTPEVLSHELVHATSYQTVLDYYNGGQVDGVVSDAIQRIELLMTDFLNNDIMTTNGRFNDGVTDAMNAINEALVDVSMDPAQQQATALNEFMAWALTNQGITTQAEKIPSLVRMAQSVVKYIKSLIWGRKKAPAMADDFLSTLQFNTGIVIRSQSSLASQITQATLMHKSRGAEDRITDLRDNLANTVVTMLGRQGVDEALMSQDKSWTDALTMATDVAMQLDTRFDLTPAESSTLRMVVAAMATEARLDTNALNRAQEIYTHVTRNLKTEDLMDPNAPDWNVEYNYAAKKYDAIMGKDVRGVDAQGRTTMLPAFIGLAAVSESFRQVLAKMDVPKNVRLPGNTLDNILTNVGSSLMDSLGERMSSTHKAKNVLDAMDALTDQLSDAAERETEQFNQTITGSAVDSINDWMVSTMDKLSGKLEQAGESVAQSNNRATRLTGRMMKLISGMATEERGAVVAESFMDLLNKSKVPSMLYQIANDLVGRTESNANVYDMIKRVRATVQQLRQEFRKEVPKIINGKFTRQLSAEEKATMFKALGNSDIASLLDVMTTTDAINLLDDPKKLADAIKDHELLIKNEDGRRLPLYQKKAKQLAGYLNSGEPGNNLLRNAYAISSLANESVLGRKLTPDGIKALDRLTTLYALDGLSGTEKNIMSDLVKNESKGLEFTSNYLLGQRKAELSKLTNDSLRMNHYKGYVPSLRAPGTDVRIAPMADHSEMLSRGYKLAGEYHGSDLVRGARMGYYVSDIPSRAAVSQGIMQNVRHTVSGVDSNSGFSTELTAGRITDPVTVRRITARLKNETVHTENLMPLFDADGEVFAYEQSLSQWLMGDHLRTSKDLPEMIGVWRGRQVEEKMSTVINETLMDRLYDMYDPNNKDAYINVFDTKSLTPVQRDAVKLFTPETLAYAREKFGNEFMIRRDMLEDVIGYRNATIGDLNTGITNWSPEAQAVVKNSLIAVFGPDIIPKLVKAERMLQGAVSEIRTLIVVKSVIVPVYNFMSNVYQLIARGVPLKSIVKNTGVKTSEITSYLKSYERQIELEAELRAQPDARTERRLRTEIRSITDSHKRMSIWPLIEAGEFSTIADIGSSAEDLELSSGRFMSWAEAKFNQLPNSLQTAARYGVLSKDTALFQGLHKAVQYGDFIAKATLYDDLTQRKGLTSKQALARITEEFVNYDRLPGRVRGALENNGMLWFYNFKIRIAKIALSMIRNNPLHASIAMGLPSVTGVGLPMNDNIFSKLFGGTLGYSIGPGMAFNAPTLNPWFNIID